MITQILQAALERLHCRGALVAVSDAGPIETTSAGSIGAGKHDQPYYVYSITKTYTAASDPGSRSRPFA